MSQGSTLSKVSVVALVAALLGGCAAWTDEEVATADLRAEVQAAREAAQAALAQARENEQRLQILAQEVDEAQDLAAAARQQAQAAEDVTERMFQQQLQK